MDIKYPQILTIRRGFYPRIFVPVEFFVIPPSKVIMLNQRIPFLSYSKTYGINWLLNNDNNVINRVIKNKNIIGLVEGDFLFYFVIKNLFNILYEAL